MKRQTKTQAAKTQTKQKGDCWGKVSKIAVYLLVFLPPLFFLSWTTNVLDFNKQALLIILVFIALSAWLLKILLSGKLEFNFSLLHLPVIILFLVYGLATIFSASRAGSFWGLPLNVSASFLTLLGLVLFYFLVVNLFNPSASSGRSKDGIVWLLFTLVGSGFLAALFAGFQLFGKFLLPWDFTQIASFNTIGTVNALAIFLACLIPIAIALMFGAKRFLRWLLAIFGLVMLADIFIINFWVAWAVLMAGSAVLFIFGALNVKKTGKTRWIVLPMFLLIVSLFFITFKVSLPGFPSTPLEVSPSQGAELNIAKNTLAENPVLGTGPGTFVYNYSKFKSEDLNQTLFWNVRFRTGASEILDKTITTGILGILSFFFLLGMFFWLGFKYLKEKAGILKDYGNWLVGAGVFSGFSGIAIAHFFYPINLSLLLVFWLLLAGLATINNKSRSWTLEPSSSLTVSVSFLLVLVFIFGIGFIFIGGQRYSAEIRYFEGLKVWQGGGETEESINNIAGAINLNPNMDIYWQDISQLYLVRLNELLEKKDLSQEELTEQSQLFISNTINSAKRATDISPENVANWSVRGFIYRNLIGVVGGAEDWAIDCYQRAAELEPANPYIFTELGQVYSAKGELDKAEEQFQKAVDLKGDYSNARYFLGLIYDRRNQKDLAIEQFERVSQLNPGNEEIRKILENLREGKAALEEIVPTQPPIEEAPPERLEEEK